MSQSSSLGTQPISKLLIQQAVPASIGILIMSIYGIVDTIFVGRYVGAMGIGAITVVMPITYLIASIGMAIGIGGASVISRAMGGGETSKAYRTFGNQVGMTLTMAILAMLGGIFFMEEVLMLFGGKGEILKPARTYFSILLPGIPFLAWAMMSNNVIRAEGYPRVAMVVMIIPAIVNIILDPILIVGFDMGMAGAAWATTLSYISSAIFTCWHFFFGKSELKIRLSNLLPHWKLIKEIVSIGFVTFARQGAIAILSIVLNNALFSYGAEAGVVIYGMISRVMMFVNFPVLGMIQGFLPIAGYNFGAKNGNRVRSVIKLAIIAGTAVALSIFLVVMIFAGPILSIFTTDQELIVNGAHALRIVFLATPTLCLQMIGSAYYQAIGRAMPALLLALTKQGFCLIPLLLILPGILGIDGVWWAFPIADLLSAALSAAFLTKGYQAIRGLEDFKVVQPSSPIGVANPVVGKKPGS